MRPHDRRRGKLLRLGRFPAISRSLRTGPEEQPATPVVLDRLNAGNTEEELFQNALAVNSQRPSADAERVAGGNIRGTFFHVRCPERSRVGSRADCAGTANFASREGPRPIRERL